MSDKHVWVVANITAHSEKLDETLEEAQRLIKATRAEPGCISYQLLQDREEPAHLTFVEEWASAEALDAHFMTDHFLAMKARSGELLVSPPDIRRYELFA